MNNLKNSVDNTIKTIYNVHCHFGEVAQLARAHGSYPWCRGFKSLFRYYNKTYQAVIAVGRFFAVGIHFDSVLLQYFKLKISNPIFTICLRYLFITSLSQRSISTEA